MRAARTSLRRWSHVAPLVAARSRRGDETRSARATVYFVPFADDAYDALRVLCARILRYL
eukprot:scaffold2150_cov137-Isochrysis_galbana.AAC.6